MTTAVSTTIPTAQFNFRSPYTDFNIYAYYVYSGGNVDGHDNYMRSSYGIK